MINELNTTNIDGFIIKASVPELVTNPRVLILLHGWTGNENSMWVFTNKLPKNYLLIAPRGIYKTQMGGFGWTKTQPSTRVWKVDDFIGGVQAIDKLIKELSNQLPADYSKVSLMGFSQGAALTYSFAALNPAKVSSLAGLAGFLPDDAEEYFSKNHLAGVPVYITHGTRDDLVPVERGRDAVRFLQRAGANVTYCEEDVGHRLSANCFRGVEYFYKKNNRSF